jgi:lipoprotein-releasing system permease protein
MRSLELFIAWRYLKARRKGFFTLLTTLIAVGGVTLGVASLIITLAVMTGFQQDIREKILVLQPHLIVLKHSESPFMEYGEVSSELLKNKEVASASPFIAAPIIIQNFHSSAGAMVKGVDFASEEKLVSLGDIIAEGSVPAGNGQILLGNELANSIGASVGREVVLVSPGQNTLIPRMKKYTVSGLFHSGMYEYDAHLSYISLQDAQAFFDIPNSATGIGVSLHRIDMAPKMEGEFQRLLSGAYRVHSWQSMNRNLFAALRLEKIMMFIILTLIIIVAAFNIISNLILLSVEKSREIGILSALGRTSGEIGRIFFYEGLIIGMGGILAGIFLGGGLSLLLKKYQFVHLPSDVYYLDRLPVKIIPSDIATVLAATLVITLIAATYPAYQASKLDPLEVIRYR